jgi:hypothetical protein
VWRRRGDARRPSLALRNPTTSSTYDRPSVAEIPLLGVLDDETAQSRSSLGRAMSSARKLVSREPFGLPKRLRAGVWEQRRESNERSNLDPVGAKN